MKSAQKLYNDNTINKYLLYNITKIIKEGRLAIKPTKDITVSEWADENRILPETSTEPGKWRTDRVPHSKAIMNSVNNNKVRQISIMGSSQIGKTEIMNNIMGYYIDIDPCAIMVMQPTDKDARDYALQKVDPMIEDTQVLKNKVSKRKSRDQENSILRKKFIGGYLTIVSGNSTSSTRGRSARVTIGDDIDGIRIGHTQEGDPISRLIKRSTTYPDHININISTPTVEGESRIEMLYKQSNKQKYYVECPECKTSQVLDYVNLVWDKDCDMFNRPTAHYPETAKYKCPKCDHLITEGDRITMLKTGKWIADKPSIYEHQGFWINELSSTLSSMQKVAKSIIDAGCDITDKQLVTINADAEKLEALYNTVLGLPYKKVRGEETDPLALMERREDYLGEDMKLPNEILLLTAAVDVQAGSGDKSARLELKVMGWGLGRENWVVYYGTIPGDPEKLYVWEKLDEFWEKKWFRKDGTELKIVRKFIDMGYATKSVYDYTTGKQHRGIYASKGANKYGASILQRKPSWVNKGRTPLIIIGTQAVKSEIMGCLKNITEPGPKFTHFDKKYCGSSYFKMLTSEVAVKKTTGLIEYFEYEKKEKHIANEALDLFVYCYAAMEHVQPDFIKIEQNQKLKIRKMTDEERKIRFNPENYRKKPEDISIIKPQKPIKKVKREGNFINQW